jgi:hypothetical protein
MLFLRDDGGRKAAGFRGETDDCVCRAIAIATERPYREIYDGLNALAKGERFRRGKVGLAAATGRGSSARKGILKPTTREFMQSLGWLWTPTMGIGSGCKVHLRSGELPMGRLVVAASRHMVAVIDGVIHDTHDPSRDGTRCVYGYWGPPTHAEWCGGSLNIHA